MRLARLIVFFLPLTSLANPLDSLLNRRVSPSCKAGTQTVSNRQCTVQCGVDYPGEEYKSVKIADFQSCINLCAVDSKCTDAQFYQSTHWCCLKKALSKPQGSYYADSVICKPAPPTCPKVYTPTSIVTKTTTITPIPVKVTNTIYVSVAGPTKTKTATTLTTTTTTTTITTIITIGTISTVIQTATDTSTTSLTCLSTGYVAADHTPTVGSTQPSRRAAYSTSACPSPTAVTSTVIVTVTGKQSTVVVPTSVTITYFPTTTVIITSTETSTVSTTTTGTVTTVAGTTTTTTTVTATATALPPQSLDARVYHNPFDVFQDPPQFNANYFRSAQVEFVIKLNDVNFGINAGDALVVHGFFLAPQTGSYTFDSGFDEETDEWDYIWFGDAAYNWNDDNTNFKAFGWQHTTPERQSGATTIIAGAGDAIPMTLLASNSGGPGSSQISATFPDGFRHVLNLQNYWTAACDLGTTFPV